MQQHHDDTHDDSADSITTDGGTEYPADVYEESSKAIGTQQWVANAWAEGKLPVHNDGVLASSTRNFRGRQYPDGHGELIHYSTIEAWRTTSQLVLTNTQCYSRGWANCSTPATSHCPGSEKYALPLTQMDALGTDSPGLSKIVDVIEGDTPVDGYTAMADDNGYSKLVVFETDDGPEHYRAARDQFDDVPLSDSEVDRFLDAIKQ